MTMPKRIFTGGNNFRKEFKPKNNFKPQFTKKEKTETSWGGVANWYNKLLEDDADTYQSKLILPNLLRLVGDLKGKKLLDLACGQGYFSRAFHERGAEVTGADVAPELIAQATLQSKKEITYKVLSADNLMGLRENTYNIVTIVLALQNIERVALVFKECKRVLKPGGQLHVVLNHPAFRVPQASDWGFDEKKKVQYRRVEKYLHEAKIRIDMTPGSKTKKVFTTSFHRPLEFFCKTLKNNGFVVSGLEEWVSHKKSEKGPRQHAEDIARGEIPLFLYIQAVQSKDNS